jgi:hypothetical protein
VEGVCQNASNRLLALAGADVSVANGNIYVTVVYGKYGYHLADFVQKVKDAAAQLNISDLELQEVLNRFGDDPTDEMKTLEDHFKAALPKTLTSTKNDQLLGAYRDFQTKRQAIFDEEWPNRGDSVGFQNRFGTRVAPLFLACLKNCTEILGDDDFNAIFKQSPQQILSYLLTVANG